LSLGKKEKVFFVFKINQRLEEKHYLKYETTLTMSLDILSKSLQKLFKSCTNYVSKRTPSVWPDLWLRSVRRWRAFFV